jgi:hypothetical protein
MHRGSIVGLHKIAAEICDKSAGNFIRIWMELRKIGQLYQNVEGEYYQSRKHTHSRYNDEEQNTM